ncbi:MAG: DHH family phosphoesterase [Chloroflexia bacterium]
MEPRPSPEQIADALERFCGFSPDRAGALATANLECLRSPWSIPGMEALVERLVRALRRGEPLLLFGDFDTDGVTGSAVLFPLLAGHGRRVHRYNPSYREGYGLHVEQVERFARQGIAVILTVDSGISSHEAVERARQLGLEVLITDHHLLRPDLGPPPTLWVDPPDHLLSGAQLAYLLFLALRERLEGVAGHDSRGLALSALGAQMDWVPVDEPETRAWVARAQAIINSADCPGELQVLREMLGERYTTSEMRSLSGVLNMGKRSHLVEPGKVVEALLPETPDERRRQTFRFLLQERARVHRVSEALLARAMEDIRGEKGQGLLIYEVQVPDETLSEVEGPLTARLVEMTGRPALVLRPAGPQINFSGRARGDFSFESFLSDPEILSRVISMGGHRQAIGGSIRPEDRPGFLEAVQRWKERYPPSESATSPLPPPARLEGLDPATAYLLGRAIGPFGHRLPPPRFLTTLQVRGGWAFSGHFLVETDRPLEPGEWEVIFTFDEAGCDGQNIVLHLLEAVRRPGP